MTTIVDALIVTLGLDGSKFKQESTKAKESLRTLGSDTDRTAKVMEAKGKQAAQFYAHIRNEALSLLAVFTGGRALKNFAEDTINSAANLGMMAQNLQMSTERLSAFQHASERAGGSAQGMTAQLLESQSAAAKYSMGIVDESMQWFYRMGGSDKALRDGNTYLLARADIIAKLYATDPGRAKLVAQQMGISPEQFNLIKQGSAGLLQLVAAQEKNSAVSAEGARQALALRNKMLDLRDKLELTATTVLLRLAPALERGAARLEKMAQWVADHRDDISRWIDQAVKSIGEFVSALDRAAQAVGGWKNVLVGLAALKVLSMVGGLLSLAGALGGVGTALGAVAAGGAAAGVLATIGTAAGTAALAVGALALTVGAMTAAMNAADPETDAKNHAGMRRVRRRGKPDEWVKDESLPQEHAGEHYVRAGRGGGWVKDSAATPTPAKGDNVPGWLSKMFGGSGEPSQAGGRYKAGAPKGGTSTTPVPVTIAPGSAPIATKVDISEVVKKLMASGWTQQQAAGIAGSLQQESGLDPTARNPTSGAYGIGQWLGSRVADFKKFSGKDLVGSSLDEQLAFQQFELTKGKERAAGDKLRATKTAADAARVHSEAYERPGADEANIDRRQSNALAILERMQDNNAQSAASLPQQVAAAVTARTQNATTSTSTSETNINGPITINTQATDAEGVAKSLSRKLAEFSYVKQANTGMQ